MKGVLATVLKWLKNKKVQIGLLCLASVVAMVVGGFRDQLFDYKMFDASTYIGEVARGEIEPMDQNYGVVGKLFSIFGLAEHELLAGAVTLILIIGLVVLIIYKSLPLSVPVLALTLLTIGLSGIWFMGFSKELFEVIIVCWGGVLALKASGKYGWLVFLGCLIVYGLVFRPYWAVIGAAYLGVMVLIKILKRVRTRWLLPLVVCIIVGLVVGYALTHGGQDVSITRNWINDSRVGFTKIENILPSDNIWSGIINSLFALFSFFIPIQLFVGGSLLYIGGGIIVAAVMWGLVWWLRKVRWVLAEDRVRVAVISFLVAFIAVSALYEPDFGSFLRHLTPIMLFMIYAYITPSSVKLKAIS